MVPTSNLSVIITYIVANMSARVVATPTMLAENSRHDNVTDIMTGFGVESHAGCTNGY
jgi:hypothetical protein